ncbi:MAG: metallophosphoesterase [Cyanobacteria bacterium]|nr:metallophosphoesterase [Cyanobacteriota bacterium]
MTRRADLTLLILGFILAVVAGLVVTLGSPPGANRSSGPMTSPMTGLLSDPFLQAPTPNTVRVVWFTAFPGQAHTVQYGNRPEAVLATTRPITGLQEDADSKLDHQPPETPTPRPVWRHEAEITGLVPGERLPYTVSSTQADGTVVTRGPFSLAPTPPRGQPLKILLTSDHQLMPMTAPNLQKVAETVGPVDAVFVAGDLVNVPDRASEWFDDSRGGAFFPALQGRADAVLTQGGTTTHYHGGELIQHAPLFPAIGNHEVMGRVSATRSLNQQFNDPVPRSAALKLYQTYEEVFNPTAEPTQKRQWIIDNSYNTETYEQLFSLPVSTVPNPERPEQTSRYYATTFGDVRLVSLFATQIWRSPDIKPNTQGRYRERQADLNNPGAWGYGQHIFEPIQKGSLQYQWLEQELASAAFQQAKYKVVMLHHPPHSLGDNVVPAFTDPVPIYDRTPNGDLKAIRYEYPLPQDHLIRDLIPLLEQAGVDLVLYGHSHLWNRFVSPTGMHFLETSNVGNTYGAFLGDKQRPVPPTEPTADLDRFNAAYYLAQGDPNGLAPVVPTLAPLSDEAGNPLPYIASNDITAFSILDTGLGEVRSYYFDTRKPTSDVVWFDRFALGQSPTQVEGG